MPQFTYLAFDTAKNRKVSGEADAASQQKVRTDLQEKGLYVLRIEEKAAPKQGFKLPAFLRGVSYKELMTFFKSLMLSVRAGVSLAQVFECLSEQFGSPCFRE